MRRLKTQREERSALELIEEATHQLRSVPAAVLLSYYAGSLPFVLTMLYFCSDMSRSAFAEERLIPGSGALAVLFLWMKCWQAVFAGRLRAHVTGNSYEQFNLRRSLRLASSQAPLHATGLFVLPLALLAFIPFPWVYAFYQSASVLVSSPSSGSLWKRAWRSALESPMQNHVLLSVFALCGFVIFLNFGVMLMLVPFALKTLLGIETAVTLSPLTALNTTFFAALLALTYLCLDPLVKTVYLLRCFYAESNRTGEDLRVTLRRFSQLPRVAALILVLSLISPVPAAPTSPASATPRKSGNASSDVSRDLERSIERVMEKREYAWRLPREKVKPKEKREWAWLGRMKAWSKELFRKLDNWLRNFFKRQPAARGNQWNWGLSPKEVTITLIGIILLAGAFVGFRIWSKRRKEGAVEVRSAGIQPKPDLAEENLTATELPEEGWINLARDLWSKGDLRLAARAFYLASLAHLAQRNLVTVAKFKSNRDYERELSRRAHALPELTTLFSENVSLFDRVWYGMHQIDAELLQGLARNVERINSW